MPALSAYASYATIEIDRRPEQGLGANALSILIEETAAGISRCEVVFSNFGESRGGQPDYLYFGRDVLDFGKEITVALGPGTPQPQLFRGRITALEATYAHGGGAQLVVLAEDRLQDLRMTRRTRSFEQMSDAAIIEQIAKEHSLTPRVALDGEEHAVVAQVNQSDLAFIRERARSLGGEVWVDTEGLHAQARPARGGSPSAVLAYGVELMAFSVRADLAHQCTELGVTSWDTAAKATIVETAGQAALGAELNGDQGGGTLLSQKFGSYRQYLVHSVVLTGAEARALAQARYCERARQFVTGTGLADGTPEVRAGKYIRLRNLGRMFDGTYYVVRATHTYNLDHGYRTEFDVERPGIGRG